MKMRIFDEQLNLQYVLGIKIDCIMSILTF